FAAAAEAMRRILIDNARRKQSEKHGGGRRRVNLDQGDALASASADELLAFDEALERLTRHDPKMAQLVRLHCLAGLAIDRDALAIQKQLAADFPSRPEFRRDLALSHNNLGLVLKDLGRVPEAQTAYSDALVLQKQLAADFPTRIEFRQELARSYS